MKYRVLKYNLLSDLQEMVRDLMKLGWSPQGGMAVSAGFYYQAMVFGGV